MTHPEISSQNDPSDVEGFLARLLTQTEQEGIVEVGTTATGASQCSVRSDVRELLRSKAEVLNEPERDRVATWLRRKEEQVENDFAGVAVLREFARTAKRLDPEGTVDMDLQLWRRFHALRLMHEILGLEWEVDVSGLFAVCDVPLQGSARFNKHTYEVDAAQPENNWLYPAHKGFRVLQAKLQNEGKRVGTFATIGTGSGLDGALAYEALHPEKVILTDKHSGVMKLAYLNCKRFAPKADVQVHAGKFCEPLRSARIMADVIYANLPNIPDDDEEAVYSAMRSATFAARSETRDAPVEYQKYLLGVQHTFLSDAHGSLSAGGSVIVNLGGRVPLELVRKLFEESGYGYEELHTMFKAQSQPEEALRGYSEAEQGDVSFDFYRYDESKAALAGQSQLTAEQMKELLQPHRVSATEGLRLLEDGQKIGHIVQVIRGVSK